MGRGVGDLNARVRDSRDLSPGRLRCRRMLLTLCHPDRRKYIRKLALGQNSGRDRRRGDALWKTKFQASVNVCVQLRERVIWLHPTLAAIAVHVYTHRNANSPVRIHRATAWQGQNSKASKQVPTTRVSTSTLKCMPKSGSGLTTNGNIFKDQLHHFKGGNIIRGGLAFACE